MFKVIASLLFIFQFATSFAQHTLVLKGGEKVNGVVIELKDDVLSMVVDRKMKTYDMVDVSTIFFNEHIPYDGALLSDTEEISFKVDQFTVKYAVKDRTIIRKPKVSIGTQDKGTIVVDIVIDRYRNIRSVLAGANGTTTSNEYLHIKAETAAKSAKFDENLTGPLETKGTITIVYP
tara:strand:- start:10381 stop:10911 length:531 start_codon:yes stop_codon:yes gene_type:complete